MMLVLKDPQQLFDIEYRKQIVKYIDSPDNVTRKKDAFKRYEIYKDKTKKYVIDSLQESGLSMKTVQFMMARASNISIGKKVINKLARTYTGGATRTTGEEATDAQVEVYEDLLDYTKNQKKADRYLELYKNTVSFILPEFDEMAGAYKIRKKIYSPWEYDVLVSGSNLEIPRAYIISSFDPDLKHEIDQDPREFIVWSDDYHFTFDVKGEIIPTKSPEDMLNPIGEMPTTNYADEQDGQFWAEGGRDLIDGSVLTNTLITDMFAIQYMQGYGQMVITGKNVSSDVDVGPHNAIVINYEEDEPTPSVSFASANPPLDVWMASIEQYVALLLSTNNLSPATISIKLDAANFPSGIAMLIERAEAINDIQDKQESFKDGERHEWPIIAKWHNYYLDAGALVNEYAEIGTMPEDINVQVKFNETKPIITEGEKLENLKRRSDLGINTKLDLILIDNPGMEIEEAEAKLEQISQEARQRLQNAFTGLAEEEQDEEEEEEVNG